MQKIIFTIMICLCLQACDYREHAKAIKSQSQLDTAQESIEQREFLQAEDLIKTAIKSLDELIEKDRDNVDYLLLRARAYYLLFLSKNTLVMERALARPRSLVKLPEFSEYIDFDGSIELSKKDLQRVLILPAKNEEKAVARSLLGNLLGLDAQGALNADEQYKKAIEHFQEKFYELQENSKIGSQKFAKEAIEEKIKALMLSRVEVLMLAEEWQKALRILQEHMAGDDLKYFSVHFTLFENKINTLEKRLEDNKKRTAQSREAKLHQVIEKIRQKKLPKQNLEQFNPIELELLKTEEQLTETKNHLIYRIICYYNSSNEQSLRQSEEILRSFYPEIHAKLRLALEQN